MELAYNRNEAHGKSIRVEHESAHPAFPRIFICQAWLEVGWGVLGTNSLKGDKLFLLENLIQASLTAITESISRNLPWSLGFRSSRVVLILNSAWSDKPDFYQHATQTLAFYQTVSAGCHLCPCSQISLPQATAGVKVLSHVCASLFLRGSCFGVPNALY